MAEKHGESSTCRLRRKSPFKWPKIQLLLNLQRLTTKSDIDNYVEKLKTKLYAFLKDGGVKID
jgi:hypothetical protein